MRFIDLAAHGGCSKKSPATEVRNLLTKVQSAYSLAHLDDISKDFPDCGVWQNGMTLLSTIDIVLPMTLSAIDFGKITVSHVLSDLYASGGKPLFALCILGIPGGMRADSKIAVEVMTAAAKQLVDEKVLLVGGHTMAEQEDFYLGFAAVGRPIGSKAFIQGKAEAGDILILTKPLGTSIATARWKLSQASEADHDDVIQGMIRSNGAAAEILARYEVHACTDITGYGFLGHLYNILNSSKLAAKIQISQIPCYSSLSAIANPDQTRQLGYNKDYVKSHLKLSAKIDPLLEALLYDSQVSGGLVVSVRAKDAASIITELRQAGYVPSVVGEACAGREGAIELVS
jgi:selenide, water dikinase